MIRVVKLGGSLLDVRRLPERLRAWLAEQPAAHHVIVVGGGPLVEQVRRWHAVKAIDEVAAHWLCVDLLTVTARLLHAWLPEVPLVDDDGHLAQRVGENGATIFDPAPWMRHVEPGLRGTRLPCSWATTSDAIAGRLAAAMRADEVVLLKSALPTDAETLADLGSRGYIDTMFAELAPELPPVRIVNLRLAAPAEIRLPRPGDRAEGAGPK